MRQSVLALACVGALTLAGCGSDARPAGAVSEQPSIGGTVAPTTDAPVAALSPGAAVDREELGAELDAAVKTLTSVHMELTTDVTVSGQSMNMGFVGDLDTSDPQAPRGTVTMTGAIPMEMVLDGADAIYIKMAQLGDSWYKTTRDDNVAGVPDPEAQAMQYRTFLDASTSVTYVGEETMDGILTRHYTMMVPASTVTDGASESDVDVPVELYVTPQGWMKKMTASVTDPAMVMEATLSAYNEPVSITIPSDAQPLPES